MDELKAALTIGLLSTEKFWGGLILSNMMILKEKNNMLYEKLLYQ